MPAPHPPEFRRRAVELLFAPSRQARLQRREPKRGPGREPVHVGTDPERRRPALREQTYALATTRELSSRLGITNGSLYYHVANKEDLLYKICVESLARVTTAVSAAVEAETDPLARVRAIFDAHLGSELSDLDLHATMLFELRFLTGERRDEVQGAGRQYQALVTSVVADAQSAGALRSDLSAKHLTLGLLSLLNWVISWYDPKGSMFPAKLSDMFWEMFANGAIAQT